MSRQRTSSRLRPVQQVADELDKDLTACIVRYSQDPISFAKDILRVQPLVWQGEFMQAVADSRCGKIPQQRFAIRSGTGVGKTSGVSFLILWHLACFFDSKIAVTAPTSPQIQAVMWPELRRWIAHIPTELKRFFPYEATKDQIRLYENFVVARTAREESPEAMQGIHAKNVMLIADEASGVPEAIYMAGQGVMSSKGAITILIGNPTRAVGYFFDAFHSDSHLYWTKRVSCADSEMVNPAYLKDMAHKHGEESYEYKVRVLGEFHMEDAGLIIPRPWIDAAMGRAVERDSDWVVWGFDVSDGRDKSALAKRSGNTLLEPVKAWGGKVMEQSVGIVVDEYYACKRGSEPDEICVDAIGFGAVAARQLKEALRNERVIITAVNVSETGAKVSERFVSRRVELWAMGRDWFESMTCCIPQDKELASELSSVEWEIKDSNGKWMIVDKHAGGHSPDRADAFLLTFAGKKGKHKGRFTAADKRGIMSREAQYALSSASYL